MTHSVPSAAELHLLEQQLQISLPDTYKQVLHDPFVVTTSASNEDEWLWGNIPTILDANTYYREEGFYGVPWPHYYLVIGDHGTGDIYFLDLHQHDSPVFLASHESTSVKNRLMFDEEAVTIEAYVAALKQSAAEWEAEEQVRAERKQHKQWWQFWIR